jgi:enoyl-CoA hydratase/carnithine racemase
VYVTADGPITRWTLDRPPANSIGELEIDAMRGSLDDLTRKGSETRALLITAAGRFFSAGVDLQLVHKNMLRDDGAEQMVDIIGRLQAVYADIEALSIPTICALSGNALGGGLELALACDFRIASNDAKYGLPEIGLGLLPGAGGTQRLPRLIGRPLALRLILRGETLTGAEAERIGLVHWSVPADDVMSFGTELAGELAARSPLAVTAIKRAIAESDERDGRGFETELETTRALMDDPEARAEVLAFFEVRAAARRPQGDPK